MLCTFLFFNFNLFPLPLAHQNEKKLLSKGAILAFTTKKKNFAQSVHRVIFYDLSLIWLSVRLAKISNSSDRASVVLNG